MHIYVDKHSNDGVVYAMGLNNDCAVAATKKIHGTYFDGMLKIIIYQLVIVKHKR